MSVSLISHNLKTGTCPHGLPLGACPICNGMGGGAPRVQPKPAEKPSSSQMSWMDCYIQGMIMRGAKERADIQAQMLDKMTFAQKMTVEVKNFISNVQIILSNIKSALPTPLQNIFQTIVNKVIAPLLNLIQKLPQIIEKIEKFISNIKAEILNVTEKLAALLGELKKFIEKKLEKQFKKIAKKFLKLFIWNSNEENYDREEEIEIFKSKELKKIKNAILKLRKKDEKDEHTTD